MAEERTQDPVVELLGTLRKQAEKFNARQPRSVVHLEKRRLLAQLAAAHVRDQRLAPRMSETITIAGERGVRPSGHCASSSTRTDLAIAPRNGGHLRVASRRPGRCPDSVCLRRIGGRRRGGIQNSLWRRCRHRQLLHADMLPAMLASLLGFADSEIEIVNEDDGFSGIHLERLLPGSEWCWV